MPPFSLQWLWYSLFIWQFVEIPIQKLSLSSTLLSFNITLFNCNMHSNSMVVPALIKINKKFKHQKWRWKIFLSGTSPCGAQPMGLHNGIGPSIAQVKKSTSVPTLVIHLARSVWGRCYWGPLAAPHIKGWVRMERCMRDWRNFK